MDARQLAPAMYSMAMLIEHSAGEMYGSGAAVTIEVQADFHRGSFSFDLVAAADGLRALAPYAGLLGGVAGIDLLLRTLGIKTGDGGGVIGLLKWLRNRPITDVQQTPAGTQITVRDGGQITVNNTVYQLADNSTIRSDLQGVVDPLLHEGIDSFAAGLPGAEQAIVTREEAEYFEPGNVGERVLQDRSQEEVLEVVSPVFREGNKWQFARPGTSPFFASVLDREFLRRVKSGEEQFGFGESLRVQLRERIAQTPSGKLTAAREVIEVLEHIYAPRQGELFIPDEDA